MAKHVKNIELIYEKQPISITHQRIGRYQETRGRLQELNFWKMFTRMPRTNSYSQKQTQERIEDYLSREDEKLIVISSFKNTDATSDSLSKNFRLRNKIRRYISDQDCINTGKGSENNFCRSKDDDNEEEDPIERHKAASVARAVEKAAREGEEQVKVLVSNMPSMPDEHNQSQILVSKRSVLSGNYSQMKAKQKIIKDVGKKVINLPERVSSKVRLPELNKEQKRYPLLSKDPQELKDIKSESFIIVQLPSQRVIVSHRSLVSLEIASLTKIMTFHTVMSLAADYGIDITSTVITVSHKVMHTTGTSAELVEGEEYTVEQLLYGLMLPSGNDAANELAYWGGALLGAGQDHKALLRSFVGEMNRQARALDLRNSKFANPHGLPHQEARSTAADLARLCAACMKNQLFRKITSCQRFRVTVRNGNTSRVVEWENTNKLLRREGFAGLKTGITVTAGPCLAAAYNFRDKTYISIILRAPKVSARFKETRLLIWWALNKLYKDLNEAEKVQLKRLKRHDRDLDSDNSQDQHEFRYDNGGYNEYKRRCNILNYEL